VAVRRNFKNAIVCLESVIKVFPLGKRLANAAPLSFVLFGDP